MANFDRFSVLDRVEGLAKKDVVPYRPVLDPRALLDERNALRQNDGCVIVGEDLARVVEKFFADLLDGLTAMPLVEIALSMQHIIRQAVEEGCLT